MDSRTAARTLNRIGALVELTGPARFRARAYFRAARAVRRLGADDLSPLLRDGTLAATPGIGPAILSVLKELIETGESSYLERLRTLVPEELIELAGVPGLSPAKAQLLYETLEITTLDELEAAALDGRLADIRGFGPKAVSTILNGIVTVRNARGLQLFELAEEDANSVVALVRQHPGVTDALVVGDVRRYLEVVGPIAVTATCGPDDTPEQVVHDIAHVPIVSHATFPTERSARLTFIDDTHVDLSCATARQAPITQWRTTGSASHIERVLAYLKKRGWSIDNDVLRDQDNNAVLLTSEADFFRAIGLQWIPPELREDLGEVQAARRHRIPTLIEENDITGVLHCHSTYSDGTATISELVNAARSLGWKYLGISDHSQAASYAGGMPPGDVTRQHEEIDRLNETLHETGADFRILKGIECDILVNGQLDYDDDLLAQFDYVIGAVHSRFSLDERHMTQRILTALDHPRLTILAHPTGRLLLSRPPYAVDLDAIIERAAARNVALELNADPHRLDLEWRWCLRAKQRGVTIEIGPDAHSINAFRTMRLGVHLARKAWLTAGNVLNTRTAEAVLSFARRV